MVGTYAEQWPQRKGEIGGVPLEALECNQGGNSAEAKGRKGKQKEANLLPFISFLFPFISPNLDFSKGYEQRK
jgi:hypothetical protein